MTTAQRESLDWLMEQEQRDFKYVVMPQFMNENLVVFGYYPFNGTIYMIHEDGIIVSETEGDPIILSGKRI